MMGDVGPEITFGLQIEFYLKGRPDPIWSEMETSVPATLITEMGIAEFMELCLEDFMTEVNQKSAPFIVMRSPLGMRQVFWESEIQGISMHAPDMAVIERLVEEALNG